MGTGLFVLLGVVCCSTVGYILWRAVLLAGEPKYYARTRTCPRCNGEGVGKEDGYKYADCRKCCGTGYVTLNPRKDE